MTLERMQLSVAPGDGLVARFGPVIVVTAADGTDNPLVEQIIATCRSLGNGAGRQAPSRVLVDRLGPLLGRPGGPAFCVLAAADDSLHVVIQGELDLWAARGDHLSRHTGAEPGTWVDVVIEGDFDSLTVGPAGTRPVGDPRVDLLGGVVVGSGILLFERPEAEQPAEDAVATEAAPVMATAPAPPTPAPGAPASGPRTSQTVPLQPTVRPTSGETTEMPSIGYVCPQGHRNVVGAVYCSTCGMLLATNGQASGAPTLSLGTLVLDDGTIFPLDAGYVIGREPTEAGTVQAGSARPLLIDDPDRVVSRVHAEIRIAGRSVQVVDRDSVNGTYVYPDGGSGWERLAPNEPYELAPGTQVLVGRRSLLYRPE